ncbi:hypothetical protein [Clostridium tagluense]|uniref:hypothetical protein n=1 Tax=Clostridium tagluense TaxID=360422 RepID=UPI001CF218A2|nr:hypothetical protein [Clostridium tagluense]MCB2298714.1 hypothetical protein [Clostridium tagluense]
MYIESRDKIGFGISKNLSTNSEIGKELQDKINNSISIDDISHSDYEGIFLVWGHGYVFDMNTISV